jgi:acyl-CoA thioesterase
MSDHPFDQAVALRPQGDDVFAGHTHAPWANMVGPFGGITAAQALHAVLHHPERLGEPVALTVNFCAALADGAFEVEARPVRTNRSTQHWTLEMRQAGAVVLTGTAFTALRRETWAAEEHTMPQVPRPADVPRQTGPARVEWVRRFDMRFIEGGYPASWDGIDHGHSRTRLWMRSDPPRPLDFPLLTAFADIFFPRMWRRRSTFVPLGTVSMTVYFHADGAALDAAGDGFLLGQSQGQGFRKGYFDHAAQLWDEAGNLLATTHQVVYYKE